MFDDFRAPMEFEMDDYVADEQTLTFTEYNSVGRFWFI